MRDDTALYELVMMLRQGGKLVSSSTCTEAEIAYAQVLGYISIDSDGFGYVYIPDPAPPPDTLPAPRSEAPED